MADTIQTADIRSLRRAIAHSPIVVAVATRPRDFAEWCERHRADIDVVIGDWLRSGLRLRALH